MALQVTPVLCGEIQENAYIVWMDGRKDCAVIDPGNDVQKIKRALGDKAPGAILLTHGHFDHIMAVAALAADTGAPVYVGQGDVEMLNDPALNGLHGLMGVMRMPGGQIDAQPYGEALSVCGMDFEVLPTPGHSKGSVCLYLRQDAALFSGDTLFMAGFGRTDLHGGSMLELRNSLRALFELPRETQVYPGHGPATTIGAERSRYRL